MRERKIAPHLIAKDNEIQATKLGSDFQTNGNKCANLYITLEEWKYSSYKKEENFTFTPSPSA